MAKEKLSKITEEMTAGADGKVELPIETLESVTGGHEVYSNGGNGKLTSELKMDQTRQQLKNPKLTLTEMKILQKQHDGMKIRG